MGLSTPRETHPRAKESHRRRWYHTPRLFPPQNFPKKFGIASVKLGEVAVVAALQREHRQGGATSLHCQQ